MKRSLAARILYALPAAALLLITVVVISGSDRYMYNTGAVAAMTAAALIILCAVLVLLRRLDVNGFLSRHYYKILTVFCAVTLIVRIILGLILEYRPVYDMGAVYDGACEWARSGTFKNSYDYMLYFPNNLGPMAFLKIIFSAAQLLGIQNFYAVGTVVNSIMVTAASLFSAQILRRLRGSAEAVLVLVIFTLSVPLWFIGGVFYTDSLSMMFPPLMYYLYLLIRDCRSVRGRILYSLLFGLAATVGMMIKFTVVIMLIAIIIEALLRLDRSLFNLKAVRSRLLPALSGILIMLALPVMLNACIYSRHLSREKAEVMNTPYTHWIMMGLSGNGAYNAKDYNFTRSFNDTDERNRAINAEILRRLKSMSAGDIGRLVTAKTENCFGSGQYNVPDFYKLAPKYSHKLQQYILNDKEHYYIYYPMAALLFAVYILAMLNAAAAAFKKNADLPGMLAPYLAVLGLWCFLMLWETSCRYIINFLPIIFIAAAYGGCFSSKLLLPFRAARNTARKHIKRGFRGADCSTLQSWQEF